MSTLNIQLLWRKLKIPKLSLFASWPGTMIIPQWLELPMSRTIFYGPKDVRAFEVRLYLCLHFKVCTLWWTGPGRAVKTLSLPFIPRPTSFIVTHHSLSCPYIHLLSFDISYGHKMFMFIITETKNLSHKPHIVLLWEEVWNYSGLHISKISWPLLCRIQFPFYKIET